MASQSSSHDVRVIFHEMNLEHEAALRAHQHQQRRRQQAVWHGLRLSDAPVAILFVALVALFLQLKFNWLQMLGF